MSFSGPHTEYIWYSGAGEKKRYSTMVTTVAKILKGLGAQSTEGPFMYAEDGS